jgi:hypothetical protein
MAGRKSKDFSVRISVQGGATAIVDSGDRELAKQYIWRIGGSDGRSVISDVDNKTVRLENLIMGVIEDVTVTFSDSNKFNFRRSNLQVEETNSVVNLRGVVFHPSKKRFQARVLKNRLTYRGPYRRSKKEAAHDYDLMARGILGFNAVVNFTENSLRNLIADQSPSDEEGH